MLRSCRTAVRYGQTQSNLVKHNKAKSCKVKMVLLSLTHFPAAFTVSLSSRSALKHGRTESYKVYKNVNIRAWLQRTWMFFHSDSASSIFVTS